MRSSLLLSCAAFLVLSGCIEEPTRVVPAGGFHDEEAHDGDHDMDHAGPDHNDPGPAAGAMAMGMATAQIGALGGSGVSGTVTFTALDDGHLQVDYALRGLEPGAHGFHVHENGSCAAGEDGTPGGAAGGHFNPANHPHGGPNAAATARHAGDFGNVEAAADGTASGSFTDTVARLSGADGIAGKALMVHGGVDDLQSQPSGDAGARVGCGVIGMAPARQG